MRMERLSLQHSGERRPTTTATLSPTLCVLPIAAANTELAAADLVAHVLYGARIADPARPRHDASGEVEVVAPQGRYRLRRESLGSDGRLTIVPVAGASVTPSTLPALLGGVAPAIAARLLVLDTAAADFTRWVFSEELARDMRRLEQLHAGRATTGDVQLQRDELLSRRDRISLEIEQHLAHARTAGSEIDTQLRNRSRDLTRMKELADAARGELARVEGERGELATRTRYHELSRIVARTTDESRESSRAPQLGELDEQINRWRRTLAELEQREARVRGELAQHHPDESSTTLPLVEQRATIAVAERLLRDVESEVARFAPSSQANLCLCGDAFARLHPLVTTLAQQLAGLDHLVTQYEAAARLGQLTSEATHLARTQVELRAQIDSLLARREEMLRWTKQRPLVEFSNASVDAPGVAQRQEELELRARQLHEQLATYDAQLAELRAACQRLEAQRLALLDRSELDRLRSELEQLTRNSAGAAASDALESVVRRPRWRASELLSKLTDGRIRELRLTKNGRDAVVTNYQGQVMTRGDLSASDQQLVALSLHLATISTLASWGIHLPTIVVQPCRGLDETTSAIVAVVLHDFAQSGHQLLVVTDRSVALDRWRQLGVSDVGWNALATSVPEPVAMAPVYAPVTTPLTTQVVAPVTAFRPVVVHSDDEPRLLLDDPIERFPLFGAATSATMNAIGVQQVGQLLHADAERIARELRRPDISASVVELWQSHLGLLCFVPNLDLMDAELLIAAGIDDADALADSEVEQLHARIADYLRSERGQRFARRGYRYTRESARRWHAAARSSRGWRHSQPAWQQLTSQRARNQRAAVSEPTPRKLRTRDTATRREQRAPRATSSSRPASGAAASLKFNLDLTSNIVDAPSIGPKTAERLASVGVRTVRDFLHADPARLAEQLDQRHLSDAVLVAWQHQAQLACRVPNLRGLDAQLLVGCGFTTPEAIASTAAGELYEFVKAYCATTDGKRALREAELPNRERVAKWIDWARQGRRLDAA